MRCYLYIFIVSILAHLLEFCLTYRICDNNGVTVNHYGCKWVDFELGSVVDLNLI